MQAATNILQDFSACMRSPRVNMNLTTNVLFCQKSNSAGGSSCPTTSLCSSCLALSWLQVRKNGDRRRQKLVLQSVFLLISLLGIISSFGCCSRNSPLTWFKGQLSGSGWRILDLFDRDCWIGIKDPGSGWLKSNGNLQERGLVQVVGSILRVIVHCCFEKLNWIPLPDFPSNLKRKKLIFLSVWPLSGWSGPKMVFHLLFQFFQFCGWDF